MSEAEIAHTQAEKCRRLAAKTVDPIDKHALQRMADEWLRLAQVRIGNRTGAAVYASRHEAPNPENRSGLPLRGNGPSGCDIAGAANLVGLLPAQLGGFSRER
jgi:hypothetical protein